MFSVFIQDMFEIKPTKAEFQRAGAIRRGLGRYVDFISHSVDYISLLPDINYQTVKVSRGKYQWNNGTNKELYTCLKEINIFYTYNKNESLIRHMMV